MTTIRKYARKEIREAIRMGIFKQLTYEAAVSIRKNHVAYTQVGYSSGIYGCSGKVIQTEDGEFYACTDYDTVQYMVCCALTTPPHTLNGEKRMARNVFVETMMAMAFKDLMGYIYLYSVCEFIPELDETVLRWFSTGDLATRYASRINTGFPKIHTYTEEQARMVLEGLWEILAPYELFLAIGE